MLACVKAVYVSHDGSPKCHSASMRYDISEKYNRHSAKAGGLRAKAEVIQPIKSKRQARADCGSPLAYARNLPSLEKTPLIVIIGCFLKTLSTVMHNDN